MNYTPNYHLPTWAMTDRIQMSDFNDMTAKLDAALKAEADARASETSARQTADAAINTELTKKSAFVKLKEQNITKDTDKVTVYLSSIDWSKWQNVHIDIRSGKLTTVTLLLNGATDNARYRPLGGMDVNVSKCLAQLYTSEDADVFAERITLRPGKQPKRFVTSNNASGSGSATVTYEQLSYIQFTGGFAAGGKIIIWGEE